MEKKIEKSEFLSKVEAFAHEMTTMTEKKEVSNVVLLSLPPNRWKVKMAPSKSFPCLAMVERWWKRLPDLLHRNTASHF